MALDFDPITPPKAVGDLFDRLVRLVRSVPDRKLMTKLASGEDITLTADASGTLVAHGLRKAPLACSAQVVGDAASTAVVTVGPITATHVRLYATAPCQVHLRFDVQ